jgi:hypothetical protein
MRFIWLDETMGLKWNFIGGDCFCQGFDSLGKWKKIDMGDGVLVVVEEERA